MSKKIKLHVCAEGKHCSKRDGGKILKALKRAVEEQGLEDVLKVKCEGCLGLCSTGPTVIVTPAGIQYGGIEQSDCAELVRVTAAGGEPIERLLARTIKKKKKKKD
ncbi:MAG: (2Fe-2S) ferredoxin domain-containing protein [Candidatus Melainabacteria bacterium]|nr:(2Fe-2S) ferredoxin domain-containing protein [Candidatus Melainabacteria bacterium]